MENLIQGEGSKFVIIANVNTLSYCYKNKKYSDILKSADLVLRDGSGVKWAAKKLGANPKYNFVGTDFIPDFFKITLKKQYRVFLLGARPGIAESASIVLSKIAPGIVIAGYHHGYFDKKNGQKIINKINNTNPDILLVAFGNPKQEIWLADNLLNLDASVCIGVGALFDYLSGKIKRAPKWIRDAGFEWIFRLLIEPKRLWKRYLIGNPKFILRIYKELYVARKKNNS